MKLIIAIIHDEDSSKVTDALSISGYTATKLCSSGGFLKAGNTTLLIGSENEAVEQAIRIIEKHSKSRKEKVNAPLSPNGFYVPDKMEVSVGGATIFVMDMEELIKL